MSEEKEPQQEEEPKTLLEAAREADEAARESAERPPTDGESAEKAAKPEKEPKRAPDGRFIALERAGRRERQRAERARQEAEQARQAAALASKERDELEEHRRLVALAKDRPHELIGKLGIDLDKLTNGLLEQGTPDAKVRELEARLDREAKERELAESRASEARREATYNEFVRLAESDDYAELADMERPEIISMGLRVAREIKDHFASRGEHSRVPSDAEILAEMNARKAALREKRRPAAVEAPARATRATGASRAPAKAAPEALDLDRAMTSGERAQALAEAMRRAGLGR
jgi:hypothetical protein